jgi:DNA repair protein RecN (Recombination protein N)
VIDSISINDLGVISQAELPLGKGLTVVTGETGAGKTMVVTALGLLLGQRADTTRVRSGADSAWVEGRFVVDGIDSVTTTISEVGGFVEDGSVILSRHVPSSGSSKAVVGGRAAPVAILQEIAEHLVVVHGQSDQVRLTSETAQRDALDRFGGQELQAALATYRGLYETWRVASARLQKFDDDADWAATEASRLKDALETIERVRPLPGEDDTLKALSERLQNTEELRSHVSLAKQALSGDSGDVDLRDATGLVDEAVRALEKVVGTDRSLSGPMDALKELGFRLGDVVVELSGYLSTLDGEADMDLDQVMQRRAALTDLTRQFGPTIDDVLAFEEKAAATLLDLDRSDTARQELAEEVSIVHASMLAASEAVTNLRQKAAAAISEAVTAELQALAMPDARFVVEVAPKPEPTQFGSDQVRFLLAPHPGSDPRPLGKGASGGELSRVMLALEVVIASADAVPTYIFDEVDAGVGGASALEIGKRLQALSAHAQVIVVTHLAQVACFADSHVTVEKDRTGAFTQSSVRVLDTEERVVELARMLGGDSSSESAVEHAREMLERSSVSRSQRG